MHTYYMLHRQTASTYVSYDELKILGTHTHRRFSTYRFDQNDDGTDSNAFYRFRNKKIKKEHENEIQVNRKGTKSSRFSHIFASVRR